MFFTHPQDYLDADSVWHFTISAAASALFFWYIFWGHQAINGHFLGTISYELLDRSHSNFLGTLGISDDLINFWDKFIENKMTDGRHLKKKACGRDVWTIWIAFKFGVEVHWVFLMIWSTFGKNRFKTRWLTGDILKKIATQKAYGHDILWTFGWISFMFDVVVHGVFLIIWLSYGKNSLKTRWLTRKHLEKMAT